MRWLPRIALVSGAVALVGLAAINPDAWVAGRNIDRYEATGKLDLRYLQYLSADAAPVIAERLPQEVAALRAPAPAGQRAARRGRSTTRGRGTWAAAGPRDALADLGLLPAGEQAAYDVGTCVPVDECSDVWAAFGE